MQFILNYTDKPNVAAQRAALRDQHIAYRRGLGAAMLLAGPLLDDSEGTIGSVVIIEAEDRAKAEAIANADPYVGAGVFDTVTVTRYRIAALNPPAK